MSIHHSTVKLNWRGSFNGQGTVHSGGLITPIGLPRTFNGTGEGTSPEDLFLSAVASCYLITFGIILDKAAVSYQHLTMSAQLLTEVGPPAAIKEVVLFPNIVTDVDDATINRLAERVNSFCLIARTLDSAVKKTVHLTRTSIHKNKYQPLTGGSL
jgi:putative redox protein